MLPQRMLLLPALILATFGVTPVLRAVDVIDLSATTQPQSATSILVLPFQYMGDNGGNVWVGLAVQQSLRAEIARHPALQCVSVINPPATIDVDAAAKVAKQAGATLVGFGICEVVDSQLRLTAYTMDVATGRILGVLRASGPLRQLFTLEDQLAAQFMASLVQQNPAVAVTVVSPPVSPSPATPATPPAMATNTLPPLTYDSNGGATAPTPITAPPPSTYDTTPTYYYPPYDSTDYPVYSYPVYPFFSGGFGIPQYRHHEGDHGAPREPNVHTPTHNPLLPNPDLNLPTRPVHIYSAPAGSFSTGSTVGPGFRSMPAPIMHAPLAGPGGGGRR